jgi:glycosyltransferase involved in cell wall biosynthesis
MQQSGEETQGQPVKKPVSSDTKAAKGDVEHLLRKAFRRITISGEDLAVGMAGRKWFGLISKAIDESLKDMMEYTVEQIKRGNIFNIFRTIGSISSLYFLCIPYYISYRIFQETKDMATSIPIPYPVKTLPKVAHFTDTFNEVNGVALTLRQMKSCAQRLGLDYEFITCGNNAGSSGEKEFRPVTVFDLPEYSELKLAFPPILEVLDYVYNGNFTHIHSATPGPVGLVGLMLAKLLRKPFYATYHTAIPQYVGKLTDDGLLEDIARKYTSWFYNMADKVFVPSRAFEDELLANDVKADKLVIMPRGVDTERFTRKNGDGHNDGYRLLYVGRISREKNLHILAEAFKMMDRPDISMTLVGDGPYIGELREFLSGCKVHFTGYLTGDALVKAYHNSDLFVMPSTTDTFGNVILEAHACGVPTIVTDIGGPCENILQGETGLIVSGDSALALKEGIESLLDKAKLISMGKRAREVVESRSFENAFLKFWSFYTDNSHMEAMA